MEQKHGAKKPKAVMASPKSADPSIEHRTRSPKNPSEIIGKAIAEAKPEDGVWNKVKTASRELDRNVGGEYERREDETATTRP